MKKHLIKLYAYYAAVPILTIILFSGCDLPAPDSISGGYSYSITAPTDEGLTLAALSEPDSCEDLILPYKEQAIREMEEQIDANLAKYLNWGGCYHRESTCGDGLDNDNDGRIDCSDSDCYRKAPCIEIECADGIDNDNDGRTDCADWDCYYEYPCIEIDCDDGLDNDNDGRIDCLDRDCNYDPACPNESDCFDGLDNDNDSYFDCDDDDCGDSGHCWDIAYAPTDGSGYDSGDSESAGEPKSAEEYSETNTQEQGVDEADFIKNDGSYIYILANNELQIIEAWPPEMARVISRTAIEGTPKKLYVYGDRALVYASSGSVDRPDYSSSYYYGYGSGECTYGYDCDFTGDGQKLTMLMYDITDRENPVLLREIRFSGSYLNSRRIERAVHSVVLYPVVVSQPDMQYTPELVNQCPEYEPTPDEPTLAEIIAAFDTLKQYNRDIINNSAPEDWLPAIEDIRYSDNGSTTTGTQLLDCTAIYEDGQKSRQSYLTVVSFDIDELEELSQSTVLGKPGAVYASDSALFIANRQESSSGYNWYFDEAAMLSDATTVHKFNLYSDPATSAYVASGVVKGRVLNQFSIDEQDGYLRLATTTGHLPDPRTHNSLVILQDTGSALTTVGQIDNIAPTEDIRSVRFADDRAFMVTFKKTDPLFCFDLSDPLQPRIEGELKIPGYSTYIHMLDEDHLLTIGYDADDAGERAYFQGIMLQLFDVSSMRNPFLMHKEVIGSRGTSSEAATDHLAFNYFTPRQALAIPITICEGGEGGSGYGYDMSFSGLLVYRVSIQDGFTELGGISHVSEDAFNSYYSPCGGWWTDSNSIVKRSIFMDDYVYSVAMDQILIHHLDRIGEEVTGVDLTGSP